MIATIIEHSPLLVVVAMAIFAATLVYVSVEDAVSARASGQKRPGA